MQNQILPVLIGGNSLIGDFALIKDMNPQMQVVIIECRWLSLNPGWRPPANDSAIVTKAFAYGEISSENY